MTPRELTQSLKSKANQLGFELTGTCPAVSPTGFSKFSEWLDSGYAGEMAYLADRKEAYRHPSAVMEGVESLLMLGKSYFTQQPSPTRHGEGRISRYAWGSGDYHDLIHARLKQLCQFTRELDPKFVVRGVVDTAPLLEREFAALSGIGWQAKNTMLINPQMGSYFFLSALLINQPLEYDTPLEKGHCGTCTACIDACPTDAFVAPHRLDATKCISYLTIEHRSPIPNLLRSGIEDWMFGCDVCQDVCPWNRFSKRSPEPQFQPLPEHDPIQLCELFELTDESFRTRFRKTPLWRSKRRGILRNAAIVLGNSAAADSLTTSRQATAIEAPSTIVQALAKGLNDEEPLVRGASAWGLGQFRILSSDTVAEQALQTRKQIEVDRSVLQEIDAALQTQVPPAGIEPTSED